MKSAFSSFAIAFAMYSKVPMPKTDWNESSMKYVMIFFPFVGLLIGGCVFAALYFGSALSVSPLILGGIITVIPIIITGGIHFDGYIDTIDAISSYAEKERKLEILKDPHVGAFGVIYAIVYVVLFFGAACSIATTALGAGMICAICSIFLLSRSLSGLAACNFQSANSGSLSTFKNASSSNVCSGWLFIMILAISAVNLIFGGSLGIAVVVVQLLWLTIYKARMYKIFHGVTGDTAGYFLQIAELLSILAVAILGGLA